MKAKYLYFTPVNEKVLDYDSFKKRGFGGSSLA
jgi:hypothetical protein